MVQCCRGLDNVQLIFRTSHVCFIDCFFNFASNLLHEFIVPQNINYKTVKQSSGMLLGIINECNKSEEKKN